MNKKIAISIYLLLGMIANEALSSTNPLSLEEVLQLWDEADVSKAYDYGWKYPDLPNYPRIIRARRFVDGLDEPANISKVVYYIEQGDLNKIKDLVPHSVLPSLASVTTNRPLVEIAHFYALKHRNKPDQKEREAIYNFLVTQANLEKLGHEQLKETALQNLQKMQTEINKKSKYREQEQSKKSTKSSNPNQVTSAKQMGKKHRPHKN